jgi:hypothetical protein
MSSGNPLKIKGMPDHIHIPALMSNTFGAKLLPPASGLWISLECASERSIYGQAKVV